MSDTASDLERAVKRGGETTHRNTSTSAIGEAGAERLSLPVIWAYSFPRVGLGIMGILFAMYLLKFATDVLLLAPAAMGTLLAVARIWDAVSDPLAGYLSDRTRSAAGRRRSWMFAAAVPMGLTLVMIWSPPLWLDPFWLLVWMGVSLLLYETASTTFFIPHGALGVELSPNYHERTRLFGWGHMIGGIGMALGLASLQILQGAEDKRAVAFAISVVAGVSVTAIVLYSTRLLPERADYQGRGTNEMRKFVLDPFRNPHARLLLVMFAIETFGGASIALLVPYYVEYVLPMKGAMVPIMICYVVPWILLTPIWMRLAKRFGKKQVWLFSMLLTASAFGAIFFVTEAGPAIWILAFMLGVGGGCGSIIAPAIKADVIDYDEFMTGERKEGAYLAIWNLIRKSAGALAAFVTGMVLQFTGYEANVAQSADAQFGIRVLFSLLPASGYLIGALVFMRFSFNESEHDAVRAVLDERAAS